MARPIRLHGGKTWYLRQRTPLDVAAAVRGVVVDLPVGAQRLPVRIGDVVQISLRTSDDREAKARHAEADAALRRYWDDVRRNGSSGGEPTTDVELSRDTRPDRSDQSAAKRGSVHDEWSRGVKSVLHKFAEIKGHNTLAESIVNFVSLLNQVLLDVDHGASVQNEGDKPIDVNELWVLWLRYHEDKIAKGTIKRYYTSIKSLSKFVGDKNVNKISSDDIYEWALKRANQDGVKAESVNRTDLVAVSSIFRWATTRQGGRILTRNSAAKIKLDQPRVGIRREKTFRHSEISAILRRARDVRRGGRNPSFERACRWCPWIAAYTGARISEITGLLKQNIRKEGDEWIFEFVETKTRLPRAVPIHEHLIEQGFVEEVAALPDGPVFYDEMRHRSNAAT